MRLIPGMPGMQHISDMIGLFLPFEEFWNKGGFQKGTLPSKKLALIHYSSFDPYFSLWLLLT
jgi:hypothetical protein